MDDAEYDAWEAKRLQGTSQGKKTDIPPKEWIRRELKQFSTLDTPPDYKVDLKGLGGFKREEFSAFSDERFAALQQSLALAGKLLHTSRPYLCNFLPRIQLVYSPEGEVRLPINDDDRSIYDMNHAAMAFRRVRSGIQWEEDDKMWKTYGTLGITHTGLAVDGIETIFDELGGEEPEEHWEAATQEADKMGLRFRPLTITLASEMVDAIISSEPNTEQHLNAVFQAGITIAHELGHAIYYCHKDEPGLAFWVGKDIFNETGHSLIAWLFGGFYPEPIYIENDKFFREFRGGHQWVKMPRKPSFEPLATVRYSMAMSHIQRILSAESWDRYDSHDLDMHVKVKRQLLLPPLPFKIGEHARVARLIRKRSSFRYQPTYSGWKEEYSHGDDEEAGFAGLRPERRARTFVDENWDDGESTDEADSSEEEAVNKRKRILDPRSESAIEQPRRVSRRGNKSSRDYLDTENLTFPDRRIMAGTSRSGTGATPRTEGSDTIPWSSNPSKKMNTDWQRLLERDWTDDERLEFMGYFEAKRYIRNFKYSRAEIAEYFARKWGSLRAGEAAPEEAPEEEIEEAAPDEEDEEKHVPLKRYRNTENSDEEEDEEELVPVKRYRNTDNSDEEDIFDTWRRPVSDYGPAVQDEVGVDEDEEFFSAEKGTVDDYE
ncbi:hypothetical protein MMC17_001085 [Xylographa soralifera]|nr:hypothetical protein [Xylographa soralifera]